MNESSTIYDVQYRCDNWPADVWQNLGHPTTDRAKAEQLARGSVVLEPEFEYRVSVVFPCDHQIADRGVSAARSLKIRGVGVMAGSCVVCGAWRAR